MSPPRQPGGGPPDPGGATALVCFAVKEEARPFRAMDPCRARTVITGMGMHKATNVVTQVLSEEVPALVVSAGFAGGLNPELQLGQVLYDDEHVGPARDVLATLGLRKGRFVHSDRVVVTGAEKARLRTRSGADAVEMESSGIVTVCLQRRVPVLVMRVISDTAQEELPMDFNQYTGADGGLNTVRLMLGIARRPTVIPRLMRFRRRLNHAAHALADALQDVLASDQLFGGR